MNYRLFALSCFAFVSFPPKSFFGSKARFKRRTLHVPNLIVRFGTCKVRRLNQLGSTDLYLGRPAVLSGRACRIERQKIDFVSNVEL